MNSDSGDVVSYVKGRCATTVVAVPQLGRLIGFLLRSRPRNQAPDFPALAAGASVCFCGLLRVACLDSGDDPHAPSPPSRPIPPRSPPAFMAAHTRPGGRQNDQARQITITYEGLDRVDGSARFGFGE